MVDSVPRSRPSKGMEYLTAFRAGFCVTRQGDAERRTAQHQILQTLSSMLGVTLWRLALSVGSYVALILAYMCWRSDGGRPVIPVQV